MRAAAAAAALTVAFALPAVASGPRSFGQIVDRVSSALRARPGVVGAAGAAGASAPDGRGRVGDARACGKRLRMLVVAYDPGEGEVTMVETHIAPGQVFAAAGRRGQGQDAAAAAAGRPAPPAPPKGLDWSHNPRPTP